MREMERNIRKNNYLEMNNRHRKTKKLEYTKREKLMQRVMERKFTHIDRKCTKV